MRYVYQRVPANPGVVYPATRQVTTETVATTDAVDTEGAVEVYVTAEQYDALLALFGSPDMAPIPADIRAAFQHRAPFTVICDPRA